MRPEERYRLNKAIEKLEKTTGEKIPKTCCACIDINGNFKVMPTSETPHGTILSYAKRNKKSLKKLHMDVYRNPNNPRDTCSGVYLKR